jgi:hypothetical protein
MSISENKTQPTTGHRSVVAMVGRGIAGSMRSWRRRLVSLAAATVMAGGLAAVAQPAFADSSARMCYHDYSGTTINASLTLTTTPGAVVDTYLQRWNGYSWVYVVAGYYSNGQPNYLFQRASSTTGGLWVTPTGRYVNDTTILLRAGTGTYRLVRHVYAPSYGLDAGYQWLAYYLDPVRQQTTDWCTS